MLSDGSCLGCSAVAFANGVDQARFTMVDMAHKGYDRRTNSQEIGLCRLNFIINGLICNPQSFFFRGVDGDVAAKFLTKKLDGRFIFQEVVKV